MDKIIKVNGKKSLGILILIMIIFYAIMASTIGAMIISDEDYKLFIILDIFAILLMSWYFVQCGQVISIGNCAIKLRLGQPLLNKVYSSGTHGILFGIDEFRTFVNDEQILNYSNNFSNIVTWNKTYIDVLVNLQYTLINPFKVLHQTTEGIASIQFTSINQSISNYINENSITNSMVFSKKSEIESRIKWDLNDPMSKLGIRIESLSIQITPKDVEWITIWRNQNEIDYFTERLTKLASATGINAEDAFEQMAIKEGWIKPNENIYKIKDAAKIIEMVKSILAK